MTITFSSLYSSGSTDVFYQDDTLSSESAIVTSANFISESRLIRYPRYLTIILVRGTPASGKSISTKLKQPHFQSFELNMWPPGMSPQASKAYFNRVVGTEYRNFSVSTDWLMCIDNAQSSYYDNMLWTTFKGLDTGAYFILFSSYGSTGASSVDVKYGTPPIFLPQQRISLESEDLENFDASGGLLLKRVEADDLIWRLCKAQPAKLEFDQELGDLLFELSEGVGRTGRLNFHPPSKYHVRYYITDQFSFSLSQAVLATRKTHTGRFNISMAVFREDFLIDPTAWLLWKTFA